MARWTAVGAVAVVSLLGTLRIGGVFSANSFAATAAQARSIAAEFFRSQNERRYDETCQLLSLGFIRSHALRDRRTCAAVMHAVLIWSLKVEFRIGGVRREGDRIVVQAVADGAPGRIVLVREDGSLRILAVEGH